MSTDALTAILNGEVQGLEIELKLAHARIAEREARWEKLRAWLVSEVHLYSGLGDTVYLARRRILEQMTELEREAKDGAE